MAIPAGAADTRPSILEIRVYKLRNTLDMMPRRTTEFFSKSAVPAMKRAGAGAVGVFQSLIAPDSPFLMTVASFPNLGAYEAALDKVASDPEFAKERDSLAAGGVPFVRFETTLLRGFRSFPGIETPPSEAGRQPRIYELRTYESNTLSTLHKKIGMFEQGEIDIFRKVGMAPVFFGATIAGRNMPNLTYMVGFDNLAAREKIWSAFGSSPEWKKMSSQSGFSDAEIVSNISNWILRPLPFSDIR